MSDGIRFRPASLSDLPTLLAFEQGVISAERLLTTVLRKGEIHYYDIAELVNAENCHLLVAEYCDSTEESAKDAAPRNTLIAVADCAMAAWKEFASEN